MNPNRITLITLSVTDLPRARAFYEALGWQCSEALDEVAFYDMGGMKFGLYSRAKLAEDLGRAPGDLGAGAMTLAQNFNSEAEVDRAYQAAIDAGATPCKPPEKVFWGGYSGTYADPDGHIWEVAHNPFWQLDDQGLLT
ncbi:VOC family protein [Actibacterium sp. XHP0104]|uniref:VOC family protein n=1 Tax=Actibacterium sp. XHP0104 TaxID=2984335 RepID=UPI0021E7AADB|nr:VOC family protein [Actibacterium sp. XHP0104]MCV2881781.1 VOC family protein [Actibacterium sp. XHP0104]